MVEVTSAVRQHCDKPGRFTKSCFGVGVRGKPTWVLVGYSASLTMIDTVHPKHSQGVMWPRVQGTTVLYLDYDGVLHQENVLWHPRRGTYAGPPGFPLFEHAALLDALLAPYPLMNIVLSTSWVRTYGCYGAARRLPEGLRRRVIGATFHSRMSEQMFLLKTRGKQVLEDVARRRPLDWLALDDTDEGWPIPHQDHVLITDENLGIAAPGMPERIAAVLHRMSSEAAQ